MAQGIPKKVLLEERRENPFDAVIIGEAVRYLSDPITGEIRAFRLLRQPLEVMTNDLPGENLIPGNHGSIEHQSLRQCPTPVPATISQTLKANRMSAAECWWRIIATSGIFQKDDTNAFANPGTVVYVYYVMWTY
ncbi:hypothetical protein Bbelb_326300 [Branchiostoma belcheri]|nr:hypothetical protein Bbelb_326300 [Branchiostoma belcheri]